jgi:hypothetical protein
MSSPSRPARGAPAGPPPVAIARRERQLRRNGYNWDPNTETILGKYCSRPKVFLTALQKGGVFTHRYMRNAFDLLHKKPSTENKEERNATAERNAIMKPNLKPPFVDLTFNIPRDDKNEELSVFIGEAAHPCIVFLETKKTTSKPNKLSPERQRKIHSKRQAIAKKRNLNPGRPGVPPPFAQNSLSFGDEPHELDGFTLHPEYISVKLIRPYEQWFHSPKNQEEYPVDTQSVVDHLQTIFRSKVQGNNTGNHMFYTTRENLYRQEKVLTIMLRCVGVLLNAQLLLGDPEVFAVFDKSN